MIFLQNLTTIKSYKVSSLSTLENFLSLWYNIFKFLLKLFIKSVVVFLMKFAYERVSARKQSRDGNGL